LKLRYLKNSWQSHFTVLTVSVPRYINKFMQILRVGGVIFHQQPAS